ncbi:oligosaccharide translocation protein RFT1 [Fistulifera solaris]|jgi:oligosaccharide translocation protein RFT1|uniref:Protein RFT1 homolog n=1 Tax=Fistulifera solaris TaxID=1519565 RepID=A0A1Z5JWJ0_FISSO|nr:oligosaccharide translocation protein RFT1 [Fistulifera solaris]|eukprot:GAX18091.1 oligosaccharide translocation protein RFT1 [Fistulifera solaris]
MASFTSNTTRTALAGTVATFLLRLISFGCTQISLRWVDPTILGQASIQLELLYSMINFVCREGFRLSLMRPTSDWNVAYLTIPTTACFAVLAGIQHVHYNAAPENDAFRRAGLMYCCASFIESLAEPLVLHALRQLHVSVKASAEGLATVTKTITLVILLTRFKSQPQVLAFGCAQIVYAAVYTLYLCYKLAPAVTRPQWKALDRQTLYMTMVFTIQGFFKHLLTEGDRITLVALAESYDQGVYAMGSAYGGLAARVLLQPIEENARLLWSRQHVVPSQSPQQDELRQSYCFVVKLVLYLGFIYSTLAVHYTALLLQLVGGARWSDNPQASSVLSAFCVYTAFLAWNGSTEAFVYGVAENASDMGRLGVAHTVVAGVFALIVPVAVSMYGTIGLVAANCFSMMLRSLYSLHFATHFFANRWGTETAPWRVAAQLLRGMFPQPAVLLCFLGCFISTRISREIFVTGAHAVGSGDWIQLAFNHVAVGVTAGVITLSMAYFTETDLRRSLQRISRQKQE